MSRALSAEDISRWGTILGVLPGAVVIISTERTILYWNHAAERVTGWRSDEAIGRNLRDLTGVEAQWPIGDAILDIVGAGQTWSGELCVRRRDGTVTPLLLTGSPWWDDYTEQVLGQIWLGVELAARPPTELGDSSEPSDAVDLTLDLTGDVVSLHSSDGTFLRVSQTARSSLGYAPEELIGTNASDYVHPDDVALVNVLSSVTVLGHRGGRNASFRFRAKDGHYVWLETTDRPLRDEHSGEITQIIRVSRDVSQRREAEQNASVGIAIIAPDLRILQVNRALCEFAGRSEHELLRLLVTDVTHPDDIEKVLTAQRLAIAGHISLPTHEMRYLRPDGSVVWGLVSRYMVPDGIGGLAYALAHVTDITDRKRNEAELEHLALHDSLTGLANRALLLDRLGHALAQTDRDGGCHGLLFVDLDGFKVVNDGFGHHVGDDVLREAARRIVSHVRTSDTVARLGGDEFAVVLHGIGGRDEALYKARQLCDALAAPHVVAEGTEIFVTASIGVAYSSENLSDTTNMLRAAESAMYLAKEQGRGRAEVFSLGLTERTVARVAIDTGLHYAIEREELRLYYQPVVELATGRVVGVEALLRWEPPARGLVTPDEFIPVAEETGWIVPMGAWVIGQACLDARLFHIDGQQLTMSINVSPRQIREGRLVEVTRAALVAASLDPGAICLEITESLLTDDTGTSIATLLALKDLGVSIAIDDFGTGYSSLSYLKRLPVTVMKIDRAFVAGLPVDENDAALVGAMVSMAHALGIDVVAEGVETADQLRELQWLGCEMAQGYLFARPQPLDLAVAAVRTLNETETSSASDVTETPRG